MFLFAAYQFTLSFKIIFDDANFDIFSVLCSLFNVVMFFLSFVAEVTIKQLKEKLREYDEKMEANAQVSG